jgi:two-component system CheB/CheR fusion protein
VGEPSDEAVPTAHRAATVPVVAIGASARGLEALRQLFGDLPDDTGMAFVVIQHLDPARPSMLTSVLAGDVRMPVVEVTDGMRAEPNRVHIIPPGSDLSIHQGILELVPRQSSRTLHLPIDSFFRALATDAPGRAIGVVLSGSASDGTEGLKAIKAAGGISFAQAPQSAQFRSMPESAIAAGVVDFQLPPQAIASELARLSHHPYLATSEALQASADRSRPDDAASLSSVLAVIRHHAQLDFRGYKHPTLRRRIARRMALRRHGSLREYAEALRDDPGEATALAQDILIHVTSFFRDPAVFEALKQQVLPDLLAHKNDDSTLRVWVPGCSTGEEVYTLAMCLLEFLGEGQVSPAIKIFGSDLSERAIESARAGLYTESDVEGVSPERLARFLERSGSSYRIGKQIRELCVFVRHDLTRDPPFARLDLVSCRNVLIYFDLELQRRILPMFHHCLNTPGYLLLGSSEGSRELDALFQAIDKEHRIFLKTGESPRLEYPAALGREAEPSFAALLPAQRPRPARDAQRQADHILLARYAPPGVVVNERMEVVQFRGRTGDFLEPPPGQPQMNVLKMAREGLVSPLREALDTAQAQAISVRRSGVRLTKDAQARSVNLEVVPLPGLGDDTERHFLVVFEEVAVREGAADVPYPDSPALVSGLPLLPAVAQALQGEVGSLRAELAATRDHLQSLAGEHDDATEELGAANEELIAANEELQSTNEELQSAKEELQSTNEELTTLNDELHNRNQELDVAATDLVNVLEGVQIPVIIVDKALRIRRFTPTAREISSLLPADVGRSIDDVKLKVRVDELVDRIRETLASLTPREYEVQGLDGRWFRLHIRPYRTPDDRLDGAILAFLDVDVLKRALQEAERARDYARSVVETVPLSLVVIDAKLRMQSANSLFCQTFGVRPDLADHPTLFAVAAKALDVPELRQATETSLASRTPFQSLEVRCELPKLGRRNFVASGCPITGVGGEPMFLLALDDVTDHRTLEASEKGARLEAERANRAKDLFLATLSHELRTPLSAILASAQLLKNLSNADPKIQRASAVIERAVGNQAGLINDLLDISRIVSGKLLLDLQAIELASVVQSAVDVAQISAEAKGVGIELVVAGSPCPMHGDPARLQQVVANLLNNSIKFTPRGGRIVVRLEARGGTAQVTVTDTGLGLRAESIPHLFDRFVQGEGAITRSHGGLGLGLAIVDHIVRVHDGAVHAESPGEGQGSTFTVTLPLAVHAAQAPDARGVVRSVRGVRVLLIDDDDDTREMYGMLLREQGGDVRTASSAAAGRQALDTFAPQVILCDLAMPGEDGYAFIRRLRSSERGRGIPAAALTALASEDDRRRVLEAGFQTHLAKPIDSEALVSAVVTLAARADQEAQERADQVR